MFATPSKVGAVRFLSVEELMNGTETKASQTSSLETGMMKLWQK
jgi:hypothetical protein